MLSKNIKTLRRFRSLTQEEFAREIGVKRAAIGSYEEGRATPPLETLITISDKFKISIDDLVRKELIQTIKAKDTEL